MFGLFKKKQALKPVTSSLQMDLRSAVAPFFTIYENLSNEITGSYEGLDYNPAELWFFSMAATSLFIQAFGELPQEKMQALVGMFYEQSAANLLLHMPRADFSLVHTAAIERFGLYADPIMAVINANTGEAVQDANLALVTILDKRLRVERGAFDQSIAGLAISSILVDSAVQVKNVAESVWGKF